MNDREWYGRRLWHIVIMTGLVVTLPLSMFAQQVIYAPGPARMPLAIRPQEIRAGTQNPNAGEYALDSLHGLRKYLVYVPAPCAGSHRCPLVVFLHPAAEDSRYVVTRWRPVADKYGMILLAPTAASEDNWGRVDQANIDAAMTHVFRNFAIDSGKIALIGYSASGAAAVALGGQRLDLFSRIILGSTSFLGPESNVISRDSAAYFFDPRNRTSEFLVTNSLKESRTHFASVRVLREAGHPVTQFLGLRGHGSRAEDWDMMGKWLQESWSSGRASRVVPHAGGDSVPLLTNDVLEKMTAFWTKFQREPDSIRTAARQSHLRERTVLVADYRPSVLMVDIPALAAQYPSVAADLQSAGLTAAQCEAYRIALVSARIAAFVVHGPIVEWASTDASKVKVQLNGGDNSADVPNLVDILKSIDARASSGKSPVSIKRTSVQGKNLAFMDTHQAKVNVLLATGIMNMP